MSANCVECGKPMWEPQYTRCDVCADALLQRELAKMVLENNPVKKHEAMSAKPDPIKAVEAAIRYYSHSGVLEWQRVKALALFGRHVLGLLAERPTGCISEHGLACEAARTFGITARVSSVPWVTGAEPWLEPKEPA